MWSESGYGAVAVGGQRADGDEAVHVCGFVAQGRHEAGEEAPAAPELDGGGHQEQEKVDVLLREFDAESVVEHTDGHDEDGEDGTCNEPSAQGIVFGPALYLLFAFAILVLFYNSCTVSGVQNSFDKCAGIHTDVVDGGLVCGKVDVDVYDAGDFVEGFVHAGDAGSAAHVGNGKGEFTSADVVAQAAHFFGELVDARLFEVEGDGGLFGGEVDVRAEDARDFLQAFFNTRRAGGTGHATDGKAEDIGLFDRFCHCEPFLFQAMFVIEVLMCEYKYIGIVRFCQSGVDDRFSGFSPSSSGRTKSPSLRMRVLSKRISPPPCSGVWIWTISQCTLERFPLSASS